MNKLIGRDKGLTLIELLVVLAVLVVIVAVAIPNIIGSIDRGGEPLYFGDKDTLWTSVATFWSDVHRGPYDDGGIWRWGDVDGQPLDHYFPTANGKDSYIQTSDIVTDRDNPILFVDADTDDEYDPGEAASDDEIASAAIWMGLLVNAARDAADPGDDNRGTAAPMTGEGHLYIIEYPKSSSVQYNGNLWSDHGTYTWIIGKSGRLYGAYKKGGSWYSGYSGAYP